MSKSLVVTRRPETVGGLIAGLLGAGYESRTVDTALSALLELERRPVEVLVLDLFDWEQVERSLLPALVQRHLERRVVALVPEADTRGLRAVLEQSQVRLVLDPPDLAVLAEALQSPPGAAGALEIEAEPTTPEVDRVGDALSRTLAGLTHHLRNPLTGVSGYAQVLAEPSTVDDADRVRQAQSILGLVKRMEEVLRDLERFVQDRRPNRRPVRLSSLERPVRRHLERIEAVGRIELGPADHEILADEDLLSRAIGALARWVDASRPDGAPTHSEKVDVTGRVGPQGEWTLAVRGRRRGPLPDLRSDLFLPFHEAARAGDSLGLELAAAKGVFLAHGGTLDAALDSQGRVVFSGTLPGRTRS